ncbi:VOC family protein [Bradyrhizobium sp. NBAIM08]|uniref:VOC family protein n=1 Tax=Bradyrhizobium sp. NBAIM08 TaxID=2793815 RepID=UPI001CD55F9A|nr:VOC family protein [Bradyrhizobium sp. NBAIM08]
MPRRLDHLVICVHDLQQAALDWQKLGFTLTPTGVHPFGTSNRLAQFSDNFLELLAVTDDALVPAAAPGRFSFAAHHRDFLGRSEGMSMLALHSTDAHADAARFAARRIGAYAPFDFGRDAVLPAGGTARVEFSLAFATDPAMPGIAFFTCEQRHPPELFWKPDYQRHAHGATASPAIESRCSVLRNCHGDCRASRMKPHHASARRGLPSPISMRRDAY